MFGYTVHKGAYGPIGLKCEKTDHYTNAVKSDGMVIFLSLKMAKILEEIYPGLMVKVVTEIAKTEEVLVKVTPKPKAPRKRRSRKASPKKVKPSK